MEIHSPEAISLESLVEGDILIYKKFFVCEAPEKVMPRITRVTKIGDSGNFGRNNLVLKDLKTFEDSTLGSMITPEEELQRCLRIGNMTEAEWDDFLEELEGSTSRSLFRWVFSQYIR